MVCCLSVHPPTLATLRARRSVHYPGLPQAFTKAMRAGAGGRGCMYTYIRVKYGANTLKIARAFLKKLYASSYGKGR